MEFNKQNIRKLRELIVFTIVIMIVLWKYTVVLEMLGALFNIIFPFLLGGAIAFVLNVPMSRLEKAIFGRASVKKHKGLRRLARPCSLLLTIILVLGVIAIVVFVVAPSLGETFVALGKNLQTFVPETVNQLEDIFNNNEEVVAILGNVNVDWQNILDNITGFLRSGVGNVLGSTVTVAKGIVSSVTTFVIAFVFSCYILLQKEKLHVQVQKILYAYLKENQVLAILDVCSLVYKTFASFLAGQCMEALILGTMFVVVMTVVGLPYALLVGILIAFTALIPIFGAFIGCFVGAFLILMVDPMQAVIFVILFLVLQQIEGNLIYPKVVGNSVGLPSIWVLAAVTIGGSLMGVAGMLVFIPLTSVLYTLFRRDVYKRLKEKKIEL